MIRTPKIEEIDRIVSLHLSSLKDGILYILGYDTLRLFYNEIFNDKSCFILAYYLNNKIVGIAASSEDSGKILDKVKKSHFFELAFNVLVKSIKKPILPFKLIFSAYEHIKPELMFLFVDVDYRGGKIGEKLVNETSKVFKKRNVGKYYITILSSNLKGKRFYENLGFKKIKQFSLFGEKRDLYEYIIRN